MTSQPSVHLYIVEIVEYLLVTRVGANSTKAKADREKEKQFKIAESIEIKADQAQGKSLFRAIFLGENGFNVRRASDSNILFLSSPKKLN